MVPLQFHRHNCVPYRTVTDPPQSAGSSSISRSVDGPLCVVEPRAPGRVRPPSPAAALARRDGARLAPSASSQPPPTEPCSPPRAAASDPHSRAFFLRAPSSSWARSSAAARQIVAAPRTAVVVRVLLLLLTHDQRATGEEAEARRSLRCKLAVLARPRLHITGRLRGIASVSAASWKIDLYIGSYIAPYSDI